jgi:hypothetical protein
MTQRLSAETLRNICEAAGIDPNKTTRIILTPTMATFVLVAPITNEVLTVDVNVPICHHDHAPSDTPATNAWD